MRAVADCARDVGTVGSGLKEMAPQLQAFYAAPSMRDKIGALVLPRTLEQRRRGERRKCAK
jgi:hypothetical protein